MTVITASHHRAAASRSDAAPPENATSFLPHLLEPAVTFGEVGEDMRTAGAVLALSGLVLSAIILAAVLFAT